MAKPVPAEGPWRSFSVSLREADLARLDAARGGDNRSEWARGVILQALDGGTVSPSAPVSPEKTSPVRAKGKRAVLAAPDPEEAQRIIDDVMGNEPDGTQRKRRAPVVTTASELVKPPAQRTAAVIPGARYPCCKHCKSQHGGHGDPCLNGCHG